MFILTSPSVKVQSSTFMNKTNEVVHNDIFTFRENNYHTNPNILRIIFLNQTNQALLVPSTQCVHLNNYLTKTGICTPRQNLLLVPRFGLFYNISLRILAKIEFHKSMSWETIYSIFITTQSRAWIQLLTPHIYEEASHCYNILNH